MSFSRHPLLGRDALRRPRGRPRPAAAKAGRQDLPRTPRLSDARGSAASRLASSGSSARRKGREAARARSQHPEPDTPGPAHPWAVHQAPFRPRSLDPDAPPAIFLRTRSIADLGGGHGVRSAPPDQTPALQGRGAVSRERRKKRHAPRAPQHRPPLRRSPSAAVPHRHSPLPLADPTRATNAAHRRSRLPRPAHRRR